MSTTTLEKNRVLEVPEASLRVRTRRANNEIHALTTNRYFDGIPTSEMAEILNRHGFTGDATMEGIYCGHEGRMSELAGENRYFTMSWYRMTSGRFEIIAYLW